MTTSDNAFPICQLHKTIKRRRTVCVIDFIFLLVNVVDMYSKKLNILLIFLYIFVPINCQLTQSVISFEPSYLSLIIGENRSVIVRLLLSDIIPPDLTIEFLYNNQSQPAIDYISPLPNVTFTKQVNDDQSHAVIINGRRQGHLVVTARSSRVNISSIYNFLLIDIARSRTLTIFVQLVGWIYFFAWSISFYPQIILNFRRKSVVGLNFDFLALNLFGHSCYSIFNICLYTSHQIQQEYYQHHPHGVLPVLFNDVNCFPKERKKNDIDHLLGSLQCSCRIRLFDHS